VLYIFSICIICRVRTYYDPQPENGYKTVVGNKDNITVTYYSNNVIPKYGCVPMVIKGRDKKTLLGMNPIIHRTCNLIECYRKGFNGNHMTINYQLLNAIFFQKKRINKVYKSCCADEVKLMAMVAAACWRLLGSTCAGSM
jgi:hypothetical protein